MTKSRIPVTSGLRHLQTAVLVFLVCLGIYARYVDLDSQFTHIDDLGVAESIDLQDELYDIDYVRGRINDPAHSAHNSPSYRLLRDLDADGRLEPHLPLLKQGFRAAIIPWSWTYAPFQFPITSALISHAHNYREVLFWGRLPSFLFSVFALVSIILVFKKLDSGRYFFGACCSLAFLSFAWEHIIYAKHMSSYSIGVFAAVVLLLALMEVAGKNSHTTRSSLTLGIALAVISHMQYQVLFFMPAFYLAWLTAGNEMLNKRLPDLKFLLITATTHALLIAPMVVLFLWHRTDRGIAWNGFIPFPILFDPSGQSTLADQLLYVFHFFTFNFYKVFEFLFAFAPSGDSSLAVNIILITTMAAGLYRLYSSSEQVEKTIGRFFVLSALSVTGLIVLQKLTFGPTRHSLIFLPYMIVCISFGLKMYVELLARRMNAARTEMVSASAVAAVLTVVFLVNAGPALKDRSDLFVESEIKELVVKYKPTFVMDRSAGNLRFMEPLKGWPRQYSQGMRQFTLFSNPARERAGVYMFVSLHPLTRQDLKKAGNDFKLDADFDNASLENVIYRRVENTGACVDVCVDCRGVCLERRTGDNAISILIVATASELSTDPRQSL